MSFHKERDTVSQSRELECTQRLGESEQHLPSVMTGSSHRTGSKFKPMCHFLPRGCHCRSPPVLLWPQVSGNHSGGLWHRPVVSSASVCEVAGTDAQKKASGPERAPCGTPKFRSSHAGTGCEYTHRVPQAVTIDLAVKTSSSAVTIRERLLQSVP